MSTNRQAAIEAVQLSEFLRGYNATKLALEAANEERMPQAIEEKWRPLFLRAWCLSAWPYHDHYAADIAADLLEAGGDLEAWYRQARKHYGKPRAWGDEQTIDLVRVRLAGG